MKVWIDDGLCPAGSERIPVRDHGLLYGDGIFEGLRVYARRVFRLEAHLERLALGARAVGIELPGGVARMRHIVLETARALGRDHAYVRLIVTRGDGPLGVDPSDCVAPRVICMADELELFSDEQRDRGLDLRTSSLRRPPPDVLDPRVKSLNYMTSVLARREARTRARTTRCFSTRRAGSPRRAWRTYSPTARGCCARRRDSTARSRALRARPYWGSRRASASPPRSAGWGGSTCSVPTRPS